MRIIESPRFVLPLLVISGMLVIGCAPVKKGQPSLDSMIAFSDATAKQVAQDIQDVSAVRKLKTKGVLEMGYLEKQADNVPKRDFEMMQDRVVSQLMHSDQLLDVLVPIEGAATMAKELARSKGGGDSGDPLQESSDNGIDDYKTAQTFVLRGKLFEIDRDDKSNFYFKFTLVNLKSRQMLMDRDYYYRPATN